MLTTTKVSQDCMTLKHETFRTKLSSLPKPHVRVKPTVKQLTKLSCSGNAAMLTAQAEITKQFTQKSTHYSGWLEAKSRLSTMRLTVS